MYWYQSNSFYLSFRQNQLRFFLIDAFPSNTQYSRNSIGNSSKALLLLRHLETSGALCCAGPGAAHPSSWARTTFPAAPVTSPWHAPVPGYSLVEKSQRSSFITLGHTQWISSKVHLMVAHFYLKGHLTKFTHSWSIFRLLSSQWRKKCVFILN